MKTAVAERRGSAPRAAARRRGAVLWLVVPGVVVALLLVAEPFAIPSRSMAPTLLPGDQVLVDKTGYRRGDPRRGDLATFAQDDEIQLKRIVGLPGDRVELRDGVLTIDGRARREPYVDLSRIDSVYFGPVTVPAGTVFVMGDNRGDSRDSRDYGPVDQDHLIGRVVLRLWPLER